MRIARYAIKEDTQTLEGERTAKPVLRDRTKTQLASLTALPVSLEALQTQRERHRLVSFVGQEPTLQTLVPKLDAQIVNLENLNP